MYKKITYEGIYSNDIPENINDGIVYIIGEGKYNWLAMLICPCGCQQIIQLNTIKNSIPCWNVILHRNKTVTIKPSIWRIRDCKSHFTLKKGIIRWVVKE